MLDATEVLDGVWFSIGGRAWCSGYLHVVALSRLTKHALLFTCCTLLFVGISVLLIGKIGGRHFESMHVQIVPGGSCSWGPQQNKKTVLLSKGARKRGPVMSGKMISTSIDVPADDLRCKSLPGKRSNIGLVELIVRGDLMGKSSSSSQVLLPSYSLYRGYLGGY